VGFELFGNLQEKKSLRIYEVVDLVDAFAHFGGN